MICNPAIVDDTNVCNDHRGSERQSGVGSSTARPPWWSSTAWRCLQVQRTFKNTIHSSRPLTFRLITTSNTISKTVILVFGPPLNIERTHPRISTFTVLDPAGKHFSGLAQHQPTYQPTATSPQELIKMSGFKPVELFGGAIIADFPDTFGDVRWVIYSMSSGRIRRIPGWVKTRMQMQPSIEKKIWLCWKS